MNNYLFNVSAVFVNFFLILLSYVEKINFTLNLSCNILLYYTNIIIINFILLMCLSWNIEDKISIMIKILHAVDVK